MSRNDCLEQVGDFVAYARGLCADVEFSPEDAGRSDPEFLYQVLDVAVAAGATTLNIPDTVGYCAPDEYGALIAGILKNVPVYNERYLVRDLLARVLAVEDPSIAELEVVVVDDGSTDGTFEWLGQRTAGRPLRQLRQQNRIN